MSPDDRLERYLVEILEAGTPSRPPERLQPETLRALRHVRRRPRWLALIKEPPMRTSSGLAVGSPTARIAAIFAATLVLALTVAGAGIAGSRLLAADGTIVVDPTGGGDFTTIGDAVAAAVEGDTILVRPGTYDESIVLDKDVTIRGDGDRDAIVVEVSESMAQFLSCDAPDLPRAFVFDGSDATLADLTVRGDSSMILVLGGAPRLERLVLDGIGRVYGLDPGSSCVPTGLDINEGSMATVIDSLLTDTDIDIEHASSPSIIGNEFTVGAIWMEGVGVAPLIEGNVIDAEPKWGIAVWEGAEPQIIGNTILNAETGIDLDGRGEAVVRGNTIRSSRQDGIAITDGAMATVVGNELIDNQSGISLRNTDVLVTENRVHGGSVGIRINGGSPTLRANEIRGAERGLAIGIATTPTLEGNTVCDNETNLVIPEVVEMPDVTANEICEDTAAE